MGDRDRMIHELIRGMVSFKKIHEDDTIHIQDYSGVEFINITIGPVKTGGITGDLD